MRSSRECSSAIDLFAGYDPDHRTALWADWNCDRRWIARVEQKVRASGKVGDQMIRSGAAGLLGLSTHEAGNANIVVSGADLTMAVRVAAHDPDDMLPKDQ